MTQKEKDLELWREYKRTKSKQVRDQLLRNFSGLIHGQVNKWSGSIPRDVLLNEAKIMAIKALDSYNENKGTALSTHITNNLQPLSRIVYQHQNTARLPENVTLRMNSYNSAKSYLSSETGREPTTDELVNELGWSPREISRIETYNRKDLVESGSPVSGDFHNRKMYQDSDEDLLSAIYMDLLPQEKKLFEHTTGFNNKPILSNPDLTKALGISQSQLSYQKSLLKSKIDRLVQGNRHVFTRRI